MVKVERVQEVAHVGSSPGRDLVCRHVLSLHKLPLLNELDLADMIRVLHEDVATASPWRDDIEGKAEPWAGIHVTKFAIRIFDPLSGGIGR